MILTQCGSNGIRKLHPRQGSVRLESLGHSPVAATWQWSLNDHNLPGGVSDSVDEELFQTAKERAVMAGELKASDAQEQVEPYQSLTDKLDEIPLNESLLQGLALLYRAYQYAKSVERDAWDFAVEIDRLRDIGLGDCDFRFLEVVYYTEHAQEVTRLEDDGREFRPIGNLSFPPRTCFILTTIGAMRVQQEIGQLGIPTGLMLHSPPNADTDRIASELKPNWNTTERSLKFNGKLVKQFKWPAVNQETVLAAFEEEGWPARIDDPLPPHGDVNPKRRLHDTIKHLNNRQRHPLIHFRGDGTGEGILWETFQRQHGFG